MSRKRLKNPNKKEKIKLPKITLNVLFKKMQKDDKKDVMDFHIVGESVQHINEIKNMMKNMVVLNVNDLGEFPAEFAKFQIDNKKTVLNFKPKGDNDELLSKIYPIAGSNVTLTMEPSQMDIDDFENGDVVEKVETVEVSKDQMSMDEVAEDEELDHLKDEA